jgi:hypothetical protein
MAYKMKGWSGNQNSPAKQKGRSKIVKGTYETSMEEHAKENPYWYKVNGKRVSKHIYLNYKNKPGGDEPGKQTNDPNVSLAKKSASKRKSFGPTVLTKKQTELKEEQDKRNKE